MDSVVHSLKKLTQPGPLAPGDVQFLTLSSAGLQTQGMPLKAPQATSREHSPLVHTDLAFSAMKIIERLINDS